MSQNNVANLFLEQYYNTMKLNKEGRMALVGFYSNNSTMTYSGSTYKGLKDITEKIESFGFESIQYASMNLDVQ
jgi:hypothetical protein